MADWTELYRPQTLSEIRGNDSAVEELGDWADSWDDHREAVILHGSPGIGKTSAAHALAADRGWDVIELNASDQRTATVIERIAGEAAKSGTLAAGSRGRKLIILDEADNLHGNVDRGGAAAITRLVKASNQPIVLVANEFYEMSQGLRNACRDLEFRDVSARSILPVLRDICRRENVEYEDEALEMIAEANSGDLRGAINDLQAVAEEHSTLDTTAVVTGERDRTQGIFSLLDDVFKEEDAEGALRASYDVDETPDDLVNWIEDNLPKDYAGEELAVAYAFLADADRWLGRVQATNNFSYWRYAAGTMTAGVAAARREPKSGWTRYGPPSYWRKLGASRSTRQRRDDLARRIADESGVSLATARRSIFPVLAAMTHHCTNRDLTVAMAAAYDLDESEVSFVTGSGKDTNKVEAIVAEAQELREERMVEDSLGAFEGVPTTDQELEEPTPASANGGHASEEEPTIGDKSDAEDDDQASFNDFV